MSTFIDRHPLTAVPSETRQRLHTEAVNEVIDPTGTKPVGHWIEDGVIYCVLDAPDADAVCAHHEARSLECSDLHELSEPIRGRPISNADHAAIERAIAEFWPR